MRRKVLQDVANTLCQMLVGWRLGDDYERIAELPDGTLEFDLLLEQAHHSSGRSPELWITGELAAWLRERLAAHAIPAPAIRSCRLVVTVTTDRIKTDRKKIVSFDLSCRSTIETADAEYKGELIEKHTYHQRVGT